MIKLTAKFNINVSVSKTILDFRFNRESDETKRKK